MTCDLNASANVTVPSAAQFLADRTARRRCRHPFALLPALLLVASFGSEQGSVGESRPRGAHATLGGIAVNPDDIGNNLRYEWNVVGSHLPTDTNSSQLSTTLGKVIVNDTNPGMGTYPREQFGSEYISWPFGVGFLPPGRVSSQPISQLVYPFTFQESGSIPSCSPFTSLVMLQMYLYFTLAWWSKRFCFVHRSNFLLLTFSAAVVPVCAHCSNRYLRTRLLYPLQTCSCSIWKRVSEVVPHILFVAYLHGVRGSGLEWMTIFDPGGGIQRWAERVSHGIGIVFACGGFVSPWFLPWDKIGRLGGI